jgi:hypothetical protein
MNACKAFLTHRALAAVALAVLVVSLGLGQTPTKRVIESPTKDVIAAKSGAASTPAAFHNPKVEPGQVTWHPSFSAACEAARTSGKPVLLFQMMGKLDEQFC